MRNSVDLLVICASLLLVLGEVYRSRVNTRYLELLGAEEGFKWLGRGFYLMVRVVPIAVVVESFVKGTSREENLLYLGLGLLLCASVLRFWCLKSGGFRWTLGIYRIPDFLEIRNRDILRTRQTDVISRFVEIVGLTFYFSSLYSGILGLVLTVSVGYRLLKAEEILLFSRSPKSDNDIGLAPSNLTV